MDDPSRLKSLKVDLSRYENPDFSFCAGYGGAVGEQRQGLIDDVKRQIKYIEDETLFKRSVEIRNVLGI